MTVRAKARKRGQRPVPNDGKHRNDVAAQSYAALLARLNGTARAVAELHAPKVFDASMISEGWTGCRGCDYSGWEGEPPPWPCRTIKLLKARARRTPPVNDDSTPSPS